MPAHRGLGVGLQRGLTVPVLVAAARFAQQHGKQALVRVLGAAAAYQVLRLVADVRALRARSPHPGSAAFRARHADMRRVPESEIERRFNAKWLEADSAPHEFDFIVVGAGSAGCALARRLSGCASATVLVIECGPEAQNASAVSQPRKMVSLWRSEVDWGMRSTPQPQLGGRVIDLDRGKTLGGSSALNFMMWVRGARQDFDRWADQYGCGPEWSYEGVLPSFRRIEALRRDTVPGADDALRGRSGPVQLNTLYPRPPEVEAFLAAAEHAGLSRTADYNGAHMEGFGDVQHSVAAAGGGAHRRCDCFSAFLEPVLRSRPNLYVASEGFVRRVLIDRAAGSGTGRDPSAPPTPASTSATAYVARGVELELPSGRRLELRARREVVLCAGALMSPQLLMLSGVGDAAALRRHGIAAKVHLPAVGRNLQDHPFCEVNFKAHAPNAPLAATGGMNGVGFYKTDVNREREAAQGRGRGPDAELILCSRMDAASCGPKVLLNNVESYMPNIKTSTLLRPLYRLVLAAAGLSTSTEAIRQDVLRVVGIACEYNQPEARGTVRLASADPHDPPVVDLRLLDHPADMEGMLQGVKKARELLLSPPLAHMRAEWNSYCVVVPGASDDELRAYIRAHARTTWHYSCTARMGAVGDENAAVDPRLRVRGVRGLRVADASVWPRVTSGNTNAPAIMTGDKGAELILQDHKLVGAPAQQTRL